MSDISSITSESSFDQRTINSVFKALEKQSQQLEKLLTAQKEMKVSNNL